MFCATFPLRRKLLSHQRLVNGYEAPTALAYSSNLLIINTQNWDADFLFTQDVGESFLSIYPQIVKKWNDSGMIAKNNWPSWQNAVKNLHFPKSIHDFYLV